MIRLLGWLRSWTSPAEAPDGIGSTYAWLEPLGSTDATLAPLGSADATLESLGWTEAHMEIR